MGLRLILFSFLSLLLSACTSDEGNAVVPPPSTQKAEQNRDVSYPAFAGDTAYALVQKQVNFGPRISGTPAHLLASQFLVEKFRSYGADVSVQTGNVEGPDDNSLPVRNILAVYNKDAKKHIMLAAHYDSRPKSDQDPLVKNKAFDAANDGASGVAVLLELARSFNLKAPDVGVQIMLFDAEDLGESDLQNSFCLGSQYYAANLPDTLPLPEYGILLDMVGAKDARFLMEGWSVQYAPALVNSLWKRAIALGYGEWFKYQTTGNLIDDHFYVASRAGIPFIDIIDYDASRPTGFNSHWHTQADNMQVIHKPTLVAVGTLLQDWVYREQ